MKIWLDDIRTPPEGWEWARTAQEAIALLETGNVEEISLDHDLGEILSGYDVACWIERAVFDKRIRLPIWHVHSANPVGRARIIAALERCHLA